MNGDPMLAARLLLAGRGVPVTPEALAGASIEAEAMLLERAYYVGLSKAGRRR